MWERWRTRKAEWFLIVGLGNPGGQYALTRHNAGFMAAEALSGQTGIVMSKKKHQALLGEGMIGGQKVLLAMPQTYMNNSGESVRAIIDFYKIPLQRVLVIVDDIDLPLGQLRIRMKGGAGTHNGMRSLLDHLGSEAFARVRIGVGAPPSGWDLADFVLARMREEDKAALQEAAGRAAAAAAVFVKEGIESAMQQYNTK